MICLSRRRHSDSGDGCKLKNAPKVTEHSKECHLFVPPQRLQQELPMAICNMCTNLRAKGMSARVSSPYEIADTKLNTEQTLFGRAIGLYYLSISRSTKPSFTIAHYIFWLRERQW